MPAADLSWLPADGQQRRQGKLLREVRLDIPFDSTLLIV